MGETDEKESVPKSAQQDTDDSKETDKMLNKKSSTTPVSETTPEQNGEEITKIATPTKTSTPTKTPPSETTTATIEPITNTTPGTIQAQEREVKPRKIPIGGIKMPGFFTRNKTGKGDGDGADGELLENTANENGAKVAEIEKPKPTGFLTTLRNKFKRNPPTKLEDEEKGTNKEGKIFVSLFFSS